MFETMDMQPSPPLAIKGSAVRRLPTIVETRRQLWPQAQQPRDVASCILQTDEVPGIGEPQQRVIGQLAHGPRGNIVQDDRQRAGDRNRPEMRVDSGLHWFVVVRHHRQHRIGAGRFGTLRQFDRLTGRIRSCAGDDADATMGDATAVRMMLSCSAGVSVEASPLVSLTRIALTPALIWRSQSIANAARSTAPC